MFQQYYPEYGQTQAFNYPEEMDWASDVLGEYAYTGRPTSWSDWYQTAKQTTHNDVMDSIKEAMAQADVMGLRNSTVAQRQAEDIASRASQGLAKEYMGLETGALESAANRGLSAAGMLPGVAQQRQQMPMDFANSAYNMGQGMTGSYNNMLAPIMQEWLRTQPENSPWMQYAMQMAGMSPTGGGSSSYAPQTYQPSCMSQLLGLGGTLGAAAL